jgi:hypothetical protein
MRDAEVEGAQRDRTCVTVIVDASEVMPQAQRDLGQVQTRPTTPGLERSMGVAGGVGLVHPTNQITDPDLASA